MNFIIDESRFEATLKEKLGDHYERALEIFRKIGESKSLELIQIFVHAIEQSREAKIIAELERHTKKIPLDRFDLEEISKALENAKKELGI